jgi:hypothetical protein
MLGDEAGIQVEPLNIGGRWICDAVRIRQSEADGGGGELAGSGGPQGDINVLSRKHVHLVLCAVCAAAATVCVTAGGDEPAFVYADCDGGCAGAAWAPVEGFSGCPRWPSSLRPGASTSCSAAAYSPRSKAGSVAATTTMKAPACREAGGSDELAGGDGLQGGGELAGANTLSRKHVRAARLAAGGGMPAYL